jgi:hypothetical protein
MEGKDELLLLSLLFTLSFIENKVGELLILEQLVDLGCISLSFFFLKGFVGVAFGKYF